MSSVNVPSGYKGAFETTIKDKEGNLIVVIKTRSISYFDNYDKFRVRYCNKHRKDKLWSSFREGKLDILTLLYGLKIKIGGK